MIERLISEQVYLLYIMFIMMSVGMIKEHDLFSEVYLYLQKSFKSKRLVVGIISAIIGVLPIPGRVTASAGILDTMIDDNCKSKSKFGIVDYLATHHYYLWSPLEKTVLIPMGALGITYSALMIQLSPILITSLILIVGYIFFFVKESDIKFDPGSEMKISRVTRGILPLFIAIGGAAYGINPLWAYGGLTFYYMLLTMTWDVAKLNSYINWNLLVTVFVIIIIAAAARENTAEIESYLEKTPFNTSSFYGWISLSLVAFISSFCLGSSGRFVALAVILCSIYGNQYFLWFFTLEFAGYLVSPMHKCAAIGMMYFKSPFIEYASVLTIWALSLIVISGLLTFTQL